MYIDRVANRQARMELCRRTPGRRALAGATKGLTSKIRDARNTVKVVDALVHSALKDDAVLLASWNNIKRLGGSRTKAAETPVTQPVATADSHRGIRAKVPAIHGERTAPGTTLKPEDRNHPTSNASGGT